MANDKPASYEFEPFLLVVRERVLWKGTEAISLTPKEFDTLYVLVREAGRLVTKEQILSEVWPDSFVADGSLSRNISVLRRVLGDGYIQTVPKSGYRFSGIVKPLEISPAGIEAGSNGQLNKNSTISRQEDARTSDGSAPPKADARVTRPASNWTDRHNRQKYAIGVAVFVLVIAIISTGAVLLKRARTSAQVTRPSFARLLVLPVQNLTGLADQEYLTDGLTEQLISRLGKIAPQSLGVIASTTAMSLDKSSKSPAQIGKDLHVDYVLDSSLYRQENTIRISLRLVRVDDEVSMWSAQYERDVGNLIGIPDELALSVARPLGVTHPANIVQDDETKDAEAYDDYLKGRFFWNKRLKEDVSIAEEFFSKAAVRDPNYANAYAGLADSYILLAGNHMPAEAAFKKAREAAQKAILLDDTLAEPHTSLAYILYARDWDWVNAEREYKRALELDPQYALAHHWYSIYLTSMKRFPEAIVQAEMALELDPLSQSINYNAGMTFMLAKQDERALRQLKSAIALDPNNPVAYGYLGQLYESQHKYDDAIVQFKRADSLETDGKTYQFELAGSYIRSGKLLEARKLSRNLEMYAQTHYTNPYSFALMYSGYQDPARVLPWLNRAITEHYCTALEINTDPRLDFLRTDPRFQRLASVMHLPIH
ncbi:MAG: tetratricopeptide repeat protein [Candidatus Acidiferrales bacterium]